MNSDWQTPNLGDAPSEYNKDYMDSLIRQLNVMLEALRAPGIVLAQEYRTWDGSAWVPATGATNLGYTASPTDGTVTSDTGTGATVPLANGTNSGLMAPGDFTKLGGIESGATADQTASEIKTAYESNADTNAFTDADHTKLDSLHAGYDTDEVVLIPTDFSTLQSAIDTLHKRPAKEGVRYLLTIETGHTPASGIIVENGDYGRFWIQSQSGTVSLDAAWSGTEDFMQGVNARLPVLDCLINAGNKGRVGILASSTSSVYVTPGSGITNMGGGGADPAGQAIRLSHGSTAMVAESVFTGAQRNGIEATQGCSVSAGLANFSNAGECGVFLSRGCMFHGHDMNCSGAGTVGVRVARSYASIRGSNLQNAGTHGIWAFEGAIVAARGANCSGASSDGVHCFQGSAWVDISNGTINNCTNYGINALDGSKVIAEGVSMSGNDVRAITMQYGSELSARNATISGSGQSSSTGVVVFTHGSRGAMVGASISGGPGNTLRLEDGSHVDITNGSVTGGGVRDISVATGSLLVAFNCTTSSSPPSPDTGDCSPSTFNNLTSGGVLFA